MTQEEIIDKLERYCSYQDRCHQEVRYKLINMKVYGDQLEEVMTHLIREDFLNEERFARSYARGKFKIKKWGKQRILRELKTRQISDYCIKKAMSEIDEDDYRDTIIQVILKRLGPAKINDLDAVEKQKLFRFCYSRGYENNVIQEAFHKLSS